MTGEERQARRASLSLLALISFVASFVIARVFTALSRGIVVLRGGGFHIHHFWYGIILLAIGGWLGISYNEERINRLAAVIYGAGGGLIADEAGLLLSGNYWTGITYTLVVIILVFVSALILITRYSKAISAEIKGFTRSRVSFYFGIVLAAVSIAFLTARNFLVASISVATTIVACVIIIGYIAQRIRAKR